MQRAQWVPFLRLTFSLGPRELPKIVRLSLSLVLCSFCSLYAGCSGCASKGTPVTGNDAQTSGATQSETAISQQGSGNNSVITVTYNDETGNGSNIVYTPTSRTVYAGASLMGWSYSTDNGNTWTYGGKVMPPQNWAILWGDPSITASRVRPNYVFISNNAVPMQKYPGPGGIVTTLMNGNAPFYYAIGGACIARSADYGKTFNPWQCVHSPSFNFYDGSSMAAGPNGDIYAAYANALAEQIDIWQSPDENGTFTVLPNPFPGIPAGHHPRLRVGLDGALYVVTLAVRNQINQIVINRFLNGQWGTPQAACDGVANYSSIQLPDQNRVWDVAAQYSFDVGAPSIFGNDEVRVACTVQDPQSGRFYLRTSYCPLDLSSGCQDAPGWSTSTENSPGFRGDQFNPLIAAVPGIPSVTAPEWTVTYMSREYDPQGNTVSVQQGNLGMLPNPPQRVFFEFDLVPSQVVCPDNRGYWGDYDGITYTFSSPSPGLLPRPLFIRAETDSTAGCTQRWDETSQQVHVSSSQFY